MSIVRQGLAEDSKFGAGYEAIFGKKTGGAKGVKKPAGKKSTGSKKGTVKKAKK